MCNYHRPVCVKCHIDMRPEKNGVYFVEDDGQGSPYKLWAADKWKCPECASEVLIGFGKAAFAHRDDSNFNEVLENVMKETHTVREKHD